MLLISIILNRILTFLITFRINLFYFTAWYVFGTINMMSAEWHCIWETCILIFKISSSHNTSAFEPCPRSSNLSTIATHWLAFKKSTTSSSISSWQQSIELTIGFNTKSVIISFSCTMSPAWSTICLISDMSNNWSTFGPLFIWIESFRNIEGDILEVEDLSSFDSPGRVYYSSHHLLYLVSCHIFETRRFFSYPCWIFWLYIFYDLVIINRFIWFKKSLADTFFEAVIRHNIDSLNIFDNKSLKHWELKEKVLNIISILRFGIEDYLVAKFTNKVFFTVEFVNCPCWKC